jgi:hypothetical protein
MTPDKTNKGSKTRVYKTWIASETRVFETWYAVEDDAPSKTPRLTGVIEKHKRNAIRERDEYFRGCNVVQVQVSWTPSAKRLNRSKKAT